MLFVRCRNRDSLLVPPPPQNPIVQSSSGKVKLFFEPSKGKIAYYSVSIAPKGQPNNIIAQKTISQQPYSAIIDEEMIRPGNAYIATFTSYNDALEESKVKVMFIMDAPDTPRLVNSKTGATWIELVWNTDKDVDYFQVEVTKSSNKNVVFAEKRFSNNIKRVTGLEMNAEYQFQVYSVVKDIPSVPLTKHLITKKTAAIGGGLAANRQIGNFMQTTAPRSLNQFVGPSALEIFEAGSQKYCINTADDTNFKVTDIYFLVKDLSEVQFQDWEKTKTWLIEIIEKIPISQKHIRVALAAYSNDLRVEFEFDKFDNADDIIQHIFNLETRFKTPRNGRFNRAITKTVQYIFSNKQFRENAVSYMYILTNSVSEDLFSNADIMPFGWGRKEQKFRIRYFRAPSGGLNEVGRPQHLPSKSRRNLTQSLRPSTSEMNSSILNT